MTRYPLPPSFRHEIEPPPVTDHSFGGICACGFGAAALLCVLGGLGLLIIDPAGRRQFQGFFYFLLMYLPPLVLCPIGLVCALFGITQTERKRTYAWIGLAVNIAGLVFWFGLRAYVRQA